MSLLLLESFLWRIASTCCFLLEKPAQQAASCEGRAGPFAQAPPSGNALAFEHHEGHTRAKCGPGEGGVAGGCKWGLGTRGWNAARSEGGSEKGRVLPKAPLPSQVFPEEAGSGRISRERSACGRSWNGNTWVPCVLQAPPPGPLSHLETRPQFLSALHPPNSDSPGRGASAQGPAWCWVGGGQPLWLQAHGATHPGRTRDCPRRSPSRAPSPTPQNSGKPLAKISAEVGAESGKNTMPPPTQPRILPALLLGV